MNAALSYLQAAQAILERIQATQLQPVEAAAEICANAIAGGGWSTCLAPATPG